MVQASRRTRHSTPPVPRPGGDEPGVGIEPAALVDLVAGDPPVPITVWRTAYDGERAATVPTRLAYRLVSAYSRPGETVIDFTDGHALTDACLCGRRRHHKAQFTSDARPAISATTPPTAATTSARTGPDTSSPPSSTAGFRSRFGACSQSGSGTEDRTGPRTDSGSASGPGTGAGTGEAEPPDLTQWFGDDLTDPTLPPPAPAVAEPRTGDSGASLAVACWPLDASSGQANRIRLTRLLAACSDLLRPGGCLVLVAGIPHGTPAVPEDFRPLVAAAAAAGPDPWQAVTHLPVHATCLVFAQAEAPRPRQGR